MANLRQTAISLRPLQRSEWEILRELRLHALKTDPRVFSSSYELEADRSPQEWQDTIEGPDHQVFGLFKDDRLIGITACFAWREDPSGETAVLAMSFIVPEHRGQGLSHVLYKGRLEWIRTHPQFRRECDFGQSEPAARLQGLQASFSHMG
jgi:GNAT superfamily N-acetyltransferase